MDYQLEIENIFDSINQYYSGLIDIEQLEATISSKIKNFDSYDTRNIYNELLRLDANIDSIRFAVSKENQIDKMKECVGLFRKQISKVKR